MAALQPAAPAPAPAPEAAPSAQVVGNAFVQQYYLVLHQSPDLVYRFYQDASRVARPSAGGGAGGMDSVTTMEAIGEKIMGMDVVKAEIRTVDSQASLGGGFTVLVTGHLTGRDGVRREFSQSFFLAPQEKGYFVLNDMFRFVSDGPAPAAVEVQTEADVVVPPVAAPLANGTAAPAVETAVSEHDVAPQQEQHVVEHAPLQPEEEEEEEVYNPPPEEAMDEEQPVPEVINEVPTNVAPAVATTVAPVPQEEAPKKSYASIVKVMKEVPLAAPAPPARPTPPKPEKQSPAPTPVTDAPPFNSNPENNNIQEPEVDAHAIYVRNLPLNATETELEDEFKKFGTIKQNGIQVRSNKIQGFCYGFVEFEEAPAVQSAIEASPVTIGGRQCYIEEKRTPGARGSSRGGRFAPGRGNNFRNEGMRGRGNYSGGRGYGRGEFSYRSDYGGRGGGRGGLALARGADVGYQRVDHAGYAGGRGGRTSAAAAAPAK
ncbi:nuclear transport factor 2-like [Phragmites australis]|uniref:nuclear transport factor 2-like n=1 Tax=Phragmites australis TaxID=29695 RepID=UPI002D789F56|nr:nuclear transport factor 2-like [Phragmites australis]